MAPFLNSMVQEHWVHPQPSWSRRKSLEIINSSKYGIKKTPLSNRKGIWGGWISRENASYCSYLCLSGTHSGQCFLTVPSASTWCSVFWGGCLGWIPPHTNTSLHVLSATAGQDKSHLSLVAVSQGHQALRCPGLPCVLPGTKVLCPVSWAGCAWTRHWINLAWGSSDGKNPWLICQENCKCASAEPVNVREAEGCPVSQKMSLGLFCQLPEIGMSILSLINF